MNDERWQWRLLTNCNSLADVRPPLTPPLHSLQSSSLLDPLSSLHITYSLLLSISSISLHSSLSNHHWEREILLCTSSFLLSRLWLHWKFEDEMRDEVMTSLRPPSSLPFFPSLSLISNHCLSRCESARFDPSSVAIRGEEYCDGRDREQGKDGQLSYDNFNSL